MKRSKRLDISMPLHNDSDHADRPRHHLLGGNHTFRVYSMSAEQNVLP